MQRVVVDGATSEWIPIVSGIPQESVLGPLLFIHYTSEMFKLVQNILYAFSDNFTLVAVVCKPADMLFLAPLTGTWLGFTSGAITGA